MIFVALNVSEADSEPVTKTKSNPKLRDAKEVV